MNLYATDARGISDIFFPPSFSISLHPARSFALDELASSLLVSHYDTLYSCDTLRSSHSIYVHVFHNSSCVYSFLVTRRSIINQNRNLSTTNYLTFKCSVDIIQSSRTCYFALSIFSTFMEIKLNNRFIFSTLTLEAMTFNRFSRVKKYMTLMFTNFTNIKLAQQLINSTQVYFIQKDIKFRNNFPDISGTTLASGAHNFI